MGFSLHSIFKLDEHYGRNDFFCFFKTHFTATSPFVLWISLYTLFSGMIFFFFSEPILLLLHHLFCGFLFTLCFQTRRTLRQGMIVFFFFFFFRTHFTAAWVFLLLRMQNGEKIKDFIIHFHFLTVKVSQMEIGRAHV